eukprot:scaffold6580_cov29-Tisochrysis_lutea.AAC.2
MDLIQGKRTRLTRGPSRYSTRATALGTWCVAWRPTVSSRAEVRHLRPRPGGGPRHLGERVRAR